ncbi:MAG TPA: sigma-70 region 4 domain-containing protein [Conexibacter sp.]|nr:sigma-70 region 4 domain-containing protein [Conexibacter sp.]
MSGLETLPPDQRAVLQLILVQGRGYADLAVTLRLDPAAVRERAHAGAVALGAPGADALDANTRGRVVDYLLGQQDDGERIVTFAELGASPAACRWAQELRAHLAGVADTELPEVPASATAAVTNGAGSSPAPAIAPATAAITAAPAAPVAPPAAPAAPPAAPSAPRVAPPSPPATGGPSAPTGAPDGPRPSRLGGAILIGGAAVLAIVLAIVLIGGDDNPSPSGSTNSAQTQTTARTQTSINAANGQAQARTVGGAVLRATSTGSRAFGAALVQQTVANGRRLMAVEVARLPGNGAQDIYAIWLQGTAGNKFLGFVPNQVRANGTFTVSSALPRGLDLSGYSTVLVTSEGTTAVPETPGTAVVSGPLRLAG